MEWKLAPRTRLDIAAFEGMNCAGERHVVEIHPVGGRQGKMPPSIKSLAIAGPVGTRIVLMTAGPDTPLSQQTWRAIHIRPGKYFKNKEGNPAVRVPDLDFLDSPDARRSDPDMQASYDMVDSMDGQKGWTYGGSNGTPLKGNIRYVLVDKPD